jgi:GH35 family endo-1,4-beta-xylanase
MNALGADAAYAALVREQCRIVVAENAMKWGALRPSVEGFNLIKPMLWWHLPRPTG